MRTRCAVLALVVPIALSAIAAYCQAPAQPSGPTPTRDQCLLDKKVWFDQLSAYVSAEGDLKLHGTPDNTAIIHLSIKELTGRANEMLSCVDVDPMDQDDYETAYAAFQLAIEDRYVMFVKRHKMENQVLDEDEAGQR